MTTLYLDMNIYNRPFDDQSQMRIRLETMAVTMIFTLIERGSFSAKWSFVLEYENSRNPFAERRAFVQQLALACDSSVEPDESIRELARSLAEDFSIRGRDALHLACAERSSCDYLVTCDDRLIQQGERLRQMSTFNVQVLNPIALLREEV